MEQAREVEEKQIETIMVELPELKCKLDRLATSLPGSADKHVALSPRNIHQQPNASGVAPSQTASCANDSPALLVTEQMPGHGERTFE
jgi:hypothetical protein